MKKFLPYILILTLVTILGSTPTEIYATGRCSVPQYTKAEDCAGKGIWTEDTPQTDKNYHLLAPLPDPSRSGMPMTTFDPTGGFSAYLNLMIKLFIGICAVLSVVMIVMGGVEYMTSELSHTKEAGKEKILHALLGLAIALGAWALLYTINPDLLKSDVNIPTGRCSVPEFTTQEDCAGKGTWLPQ